MDFLTVRQMYHVPTPIIVNAKTHKISVIHVTPCESPCDTVGRFGSIGSVGMLASFIAI